MWGIKTRERDLLNETNQKFAAFAIYKWELIEVGTRYGGWNKENG